MLIVHISSLSAIIILSIVLLVNSIKTKNKLVMYLSIGTLVVSIGCLTYCLIHHFNDEHKKNKENPHFNDEHKKNKENQMKSSLKKLITGMQSSLPDNIKQLFTFECATSKDTINELYLFCKKQKITQDDVEKEIAMMTGETSMTGKKRLEEQNNLTKIMIKAMFKCLGNDAINSQNPMESLKKIFNQKPEEP